LQLLDRREWAEVKETKNERAFNPPDGSLDGIDGEGRHISPALDPDGKLKGRGYLVTFVIHHSEISKDVTFWNKVVASLVRACPSSLVPIQYWGICDDGSYCSTYQTRAQFQMVGYLDPYEMHTVARGDTAHQVILYDSDRMVAARVDQTFDPLVQAGKILAQIR